MLRSRPEGADREPWERLKDRLQSRDLSCGGRGEEEEIGEVTTAAEAVWPEERVCLP